MSQNTRSQVDASSTSKPEVSQDIDRRLEFMQLDASGLASIRGFKTIVLLISTES